MPGRLALLQRAHCEELAGVVPLVQGLARVDPLVALQPDQTAIEGSRQSLGYLRLAHPGLALEQQRLVQGEGQMDGHREPTVG